MGVALSRLNSECVPELLLPGTQLIVPYSPPISIHSRQINQLTSLIVQENCKVIFIAAGGRSGSTLLDTALGQMKGFFSGGELHLVWQRYLDPDWLCGCGSVLAACDVWSEVMRSAYGAGARQECSRMLAIYRNWRRLRYSWALGGLMYGEVLSELRCRVASLYHAVRRVTGCRVIVDSSKSLAYARILQGVAGLEFHPVHLVRDPRAVSHSRHRKKAERLAPGAAPRYLDVASTARSAANWDRVVLLNELLWGRAKGATRVKYEDFVARPAATLRAIADLVQEPATGVQVNDGNRIRLRPTHTTGGNPSRFVTGELILRPDDEWCDKMPLRQRLIASTICAPFVCLMKYPFFPVRASRTANAVHSGDPADGTAVSTLHY